MIEKVNPRHPDKIADRIAGAVTDLAYKQQADPKIAHDIYFKYPTDGKYILDGERLIICQGNAETADLQKMYPEVQINPLGYWTGGQDVDTGATNRKLGSDIADSITGAGLHGKNLSKADVSVYIYAFPKSPGNGKAHGTVLSHWR